MKEAVGADFWLVLQVSPAPNHLTNDPVLILVAAEVVPIWVAILVFVVAPQNPLTKRTLDESFHYRTVTASQHENLPINWIDLRSIN